MASCIGKVEPFAEARASSVDPPDSELIAIPAASAKESARALSRPADARELAAGWTTSVDVAATKSDPEPRGMGAQKEGSNAASKRRRGDAVGKCIRSDGRRHPPLCVHGGLPSSNVRQHAGG